MLAGGKSDAPLAEPLEVALAAGVGQDDGSGHVHAVYLDVESAVWKVEVGSYPKLDGVIAARWHIGRVAQPRSCLGFIPSLCGLCKMAAWISLLSFQDPIV